MKIVIHELCKTYAGGVQALKNVNLDISSGMFGLLGPNGAGKSTLMKILACLEVLTSGEVLLNGQSIQTQRKQIRACLGYLPQFFGVYPRLTGLEFLTYVTKLSPHPPQNLKQRVQETLANVGLLEAGDRKVKTYSGGMLRRLGIAQALINDPELLIIDEPTVGLDPEERIRFRNLLTEISRDKIIILSTHIVGDISSTCKDLALLSNGSVIYRGHPQELIQKAGGKVWRVECDESDFQSIAEQMQIISSISKERHVLLRVVGEPMPQFNMQSMPPNLEDAYMFFMAQEAGERVEEEPALVESGPR